MRWMLVGGGCLFALIVAGVLIAMLRVEAPQATMVQPRPAARETPANTPDPMSDAAFLAAAKPLAESFLNATNAGELLPLVRDPATAEPRIRKFYPGGAIKPSGMAAFDTRAEVVREGSFLTVHVRTREFEEKPLTFIPTADGLRIDWESWVGWSEMPWQEFLASRPAKAALFRVSLGPVEYYNFAFSDDRKWRSYRLESPDGEHAVYGYAGLDTALDARLRPPPDVKKVRLTLSLRFPENASSPNQVIIDGLVTEGWVLEANQSP